MKSKQLLYNDMKACVLCGLFTHNKIIINSVKNGRYVVVFKKLKHKKGKQKE